MCSTASSRRGRRSRPAAPHALSSFLKSCSQLDRFIPTRSGLDLELPHFDLSKENASAAATGREPGQPESTPSKDEYKKLLAASLHLGEAPRILSFKHKAPAPPEGHLNGLAGLYSANLGPAPPRKAARHIPTSQERILDAPDLVDDYYLNLLDWSGANTVSQGTRAARVGARAWARRRLLGQCRKALHSRRAAGRADCTHPS